MRARSLALVAAGTLAWIGGLAAQTAQSQRPPAPGVPPSTPASTQPTPTIDFVRDVRPILDASCGECHSQTRRKGGLSLASYEDLLDGGKDGAIVRPGDSARSLLVQKLTGDEPEMPKDEDPLEPAVIAVIARWIDEGARATPSSPPAPAPWEAPLTLQRPALPPATWTGWNAPVDRLVAAYRQQHGATQPPAPIDDARFARRAYLDVWGLLPAPDELAAFVADTRRDKRARLVKRLLDDDDRYAEHWISFWNDLLRNEDGVSYFSETQGRTTITPWLLPALRDNERYDRIVAKLLNPARPEDPKGFLVGVNWRGETSAAVTPWMQASQNSAQVFLGVNLKCAACHDSFVNKWKLKDAYGLAAYFAPTPRLPMFRCDVAQDREAGPSFPYQDIARAPKSDALVHRREAAARAFTDKRLGRMPRTIVNRVWQRLVGHGIVANPDEMDGEPWSPALLDWLASDFVDRGYDLRHLIETILTSRTYQMPAVVRSAELPARGYVFEGPELRRLTAEQFADAVGSITGEWSVAPPLPKPPKPPAPSSPARRSTPEVKPAPGTPLPSQPTAVGTFAREWRAPSSTFTRALGRPIRDQVTSIRAGEPSTLQALELTNGAVLTRALHRGARRMLGELPPDPRALYARAVAGRRASSAPFDVDVSKSQRLWLVVEDTGSNVPAAMLPAWADVALVGPSGSTPLSALTPVSESGRRATTEALSVPGSATGAGIAVRAPSVLAYDIAGRGFTSLRGVAGLENAVDDIGSTLNPALRFYVFDVEPDLDRLLPPLPGSPLAPPARLTTIDATIDRVFRHALGRAPRDAERRIATDALRAPGRGDAPSADGLADLLWAILMTPEFQVIE
jgi:hypothetical protein